MSNMVRTMTIGSRLRIGDLVTDRCGNYEQYGPITNVYRQGVSMIAQTKSGQELSLSPAKIVTVDRPASR